MIREEGPSYAGTVKGKSEVRSFSIARTCITVSVSCRIERRYMDRIVLFVFVNLICKNSTELFFGLKEADVCV